MKKLEGELKARLAAAVNHVQTEEKAHARYSASGAYRWLNCPGSINLSDKAPPPPESKYATEGTKAHACLELMLKNRLQSRQAVLASARRTFNEEMVGHARSAADYIEGRLATLEGAELLVETRVDASPFTTWHQFGTLDAAVVQEFGRLIVIDYKFGAGYAVDPGGDDGRGNPQLVYYALGISHQFDHNFSEVELVVVQPRAYHESGETIRTFVLSMEDLLAWSQVFKDGVYACNADKPVIRAGSWCRFCPAAVICPRLRDDALEEAQVVFSDEVGLEAVPEVRMIQMPHLGTILDGCDKLEAWIAQVRAHAQDLLEKGKEVPGYKLVQKRAQQRWAGDGDEAAADAERDFGALAFKAPKLLTPAQLRERLIAEGLDDPKDVEAWIKSRTTRESSGVTMVRADDKRPAVVGRSPSPFAAITVDVEVTVETTSTPETKRRKKK